jgi:hypothetical protein
MSGEFPTLRPEGGLLPPDLLARIAAGDPELGGLNPADYGLDRSDRLGEAAARAWGRAKAYWAAFRAAQEGLAAGESGVTETRQQWLRWTCSASETIWIAPHQPRRASGA